MMLPINIKKSTVLPLFFFTLLLFSSCQYRFGNGALAQYETLSIPYVEGDQKGELTSEIIKKMIFAGKLRYVAYGGDLTLKLRIMEWHEDNVDFRYDRKRSGKLKKSLIPTETRLTGIVEMTLIENATGKVIQGPVRVKASTEFDHTYYSARDEINVFSLGQLTDIDDARDVVMTPLSRNLAEKIVDCVLNCW